MESTPKLELLTVGLKVDVCGGVILPLFNGQIDLNDLKPQVIDPKHLTCKYFGRPTLLGGFNLIRAVKISGVIIIVGATGWLCYRFIRAVWLSFQSKVSPSKSPSFASIDSSDLDRDEEKELLEEDNADYVEVKLAYFGPSKSLDRPDELSFDSPDIGELGSSRKFNAWKRYNGGSLSQSCLTNPFNFLLRNRFQYADAFKSSPQVANNFIYSSSNSSHRNSYNSSTCSSPFFNFSRDRSKLNFTFDQPYESFGYSPFCSYGGGSLESIASDFSIDISSLCQTPHELTTISTFDKLQQEIAQLKTNCDSMSEDFTQVKSNRYLPGLSNLLESDCKVNCSVGLDESFDRQRAKDCFRGLYSLTTLSNSISFDLSECGDLNSPVIKREDIRGFDFRQEEYPSLEWDECDIIEVEESNKSCALNENGSSGYNSTLVDSCSTSQQMTESQMWSTDGDVTPETEVTNSNGFTNDFHGADIANSNGSADPSKADVPYNKGLRKADCEIKVSSDNDLSPFKRLKGKDSDPTSVKNISCDIDLLEYARSEWQGGTKNALTILKGYEEIRNTHCYRYLRRIRGDNYCALRATLFQCLAGGISLPSCDEALHVIQSSFESDENHWLRQWSFINCLPYNRNKLLPSIETCLHTLDDISSQLELCTTDRRSVLAELMNSEPELDLLMMEAVKLHMIVSAMKLYSNQSDIPIFAMLMFARDTSETPKDFMNNHLLPVGDTAGLEQIEMFLLGYTLGIIIKVFRVSAFGTPDFICYFPDREANRNLPEITIIAEDDRHYNVLVK